MDKIMTVTMDRIGSSVSIFRNMVNQGIMIDHVKKEIDRHIIDLRNLSSTTEIETEILEHQALLKELDSLESEHCQEGR